jgi:thioesterase domain-containing protein
MIEPEPSHLVPLRKWGARAPFFCIGGADDFKEMAAVLNDDQPVYAGGMPDSDDPDRLLAVEESAAIYLRDIREIQERGPYFLGGYSFGGYVAYEIALRLQHSGEDVRLLALFDTVHPNFHSNLSGIERARFRIMYFFDRLKKYVFNLLRGKLTVIRADLAQFVRPKVEQFAHLAMSAMARIANRQMPKPMASHIRVAATRAYIPGIYAKRLVLFRVQHRGAEFDADLFLGWKVCTTGEIDVQIVPGDHETFFKAPNVEVMVEKLNLYLGGADHEAE